VRFHYLHYAGYFLACIILSLSLTYTHAQIRKHFPFHTQHAAAVDMRSRSVCVRASAALRIQNLLHCITGCAHEKICWRIYGREHDAFHARIQRTEGGMQIPSAGP
jgi:hypothetical protein